MHRGKTEIVVESESLLSEVHAAFSRAYPFLRLEAVERERRPVASAPQAPLQRYLKIAADRQMPFAIDISGGRTVAEVVEDVSSLFQTKLQICRKSGNVWNAVTITVGWTLERQNAAGEHISDIIRTSKE